ncbi:MAG: hypothetical protein CFE37_12865 [Alphaproteobacteria bacterium PA4]|nr:MAG: hypothetical protein CFE37_12865 [Alphaproteobacteria bacterium PA4]
MIRGYAIIAHDAPGADVARKAHLDAHLAHVAAQVGDYLVAGPLLVDGVMCGSLLVVKADSAEAARAMLESDPYFAAGVWGSVAVYDFAAVAGDWVGGKTW